jgi:hypothetical protein
MCGRFTRYLSWFEIIRLCRLTTEWGKQRNDAPAYNFADRSGPLYPLAKAAPTNYVRAVALNGRGIRTARGGHWQVSNVRNVLARAEALSS